MLHTFLDDNRDELVERCRAKVARRTAPRPTPNEMEHGVPMFLDELIDRLRLEEEPLEEPPSPRVATSNARIAHSAVKHGKELFEKGYSVNQVVHDYGDLCQAITELAVETSAIVSNDEFHTLNRCLDNAIADAVTEFHRFRDVKITTTSDRLGSLAADLRDCVNSAMLSFSAIREGGVAVNGATGAVLARSLVGMRDLIDVALADVRLSAGIPTRLERVAVDHFVARAQMSASHEARTLGCQFTVGDVERGLAVTADAQMLNAATANLLHHTFAFSPENGRVSLNARAVGQNVLIEVQDERGQLAKGQVENMFLPPATGSETESLYGPRLSISHRAVEAMGGTLSVRDLKGQGYVFTIAMPRATPG